MTTSRTDTYKAPPKSAKSSTSDSSRMQSLKKYAAVIVLVATFVYMFSDVNENDRVIDMQQRNDYLRGYQNAIQSQPNFNGIKYPVSYQSKENSKQYGYDPSMNNFNDPTSNSYNAPNIVPPSQQEHKNYEDTSGNNQRTNMDKLNLNPEETEANKKLFETIDDLKSDMEMNEETELAKVEQLVLDEELQKAKENIEEVLLNVFEREEVEISEGKTNELANEVTSTLVQDVESELLKKADEIVVQKEEELDLVVIEDKQIFSDVSKIEKDVKEMERFIVSEMDQQIDEAAENIKNEIPDKLKHIEQEIIERVTGMHINDEVLAEEEIKVEQKHEKESHEKDIKLSEENEQLMKKITKIKLNIAQVRKEVSEQEKLALNTILEAEKEDSKKVLERIFESQSANLTESERDYMVNEVNARLEEAIEKELNEIFDLIVSDKENKVDRTAAEDQTYMENVQDIKKDLKNIKESIIEELQKEIHKAAKEVRNTLPQKIALIEKEIINEKSDFSIDDQELREIRQEVEKERKDNDNDNDSSDKMSIDKSKNEKKSLSTEATP